MKVYQLPVLIFLLCFTSCKEEIYPTNCRQEIDMEAFEKIDFVACHTAKKYTKAQLQATLVGEWVWAKEVPSWNGKEDKKVYAGLRVVFQEDGGLLIKKKDKVVDRGSWEVEGFGADWVNLKLTPKVEAVQGAIRICGDYMMCMLSYSDGNDNYFQRMDMEPCEEEATKD